MDLAIAKRASSRRARARRGRRRLLGLGAIFAGDMNAYCRHASAVHRDDLKLGARNAHAIADSREPSQAAEYEAPECVPVALRNLESVIGAHVHQPSRTSEPVPALP